MRGGRAAGPGRTPPSPAATNRVNHKAVGVRCCTARWWLGTAPESRRPEGQQRATVCRRLGCGKAEPMQAPWPWTEARVRAGAAGTCRAAYRTAGLLAGEGPPERRMEPVKPLTNHSDEGTQGPSTGPGKEQLRATAGTAAPRADTEGIRGGALVTLAATHPTRAHTHARTQVHKEAKNVAMTGRNESLSYRTDAGTARPAARPSGHATIQGRAGSDHQERVEMTHTNSRANLSYPNGQKNK